MKRNPIFNITFSAMFLALALVMPFLTGQIPQIGSMLCPMHIPVLLCGYVCTGLWGMVVGFAAPILRSMIFGMPPMFPTAFCMAFELAVYGLVAGVMYQKLPQKKWAVYLSLLCAMIAGRVVWGLVMFGCMGFDSGAFGFSAFLSGALFNAVPGIILQIMLIPVLVLVINKKKYN